MKTLKRKNKTNNTTQRNHRQQYFGGFRSSVSDMDFKYTFSKKRLFWTKNNYHLLDSLVDLVTDIDWTYNYSGDLTYSKSMIIMQEESFSEISFDTSDKYTIIEERTIEIKSSLKNKPYFFGGICYEILNDYFINDTMDELNTDLYCFMDPTGDVDVCVNLPEFSDDTSSELTKLILDEYENTKRDEDKGIVYNIGISLFTMNGELNPYYNHFFNFVFEKFLEKFTEMDIVSHITNAKEFSIDEYTISEEEKDVKKGFRHVEIGPAHLVSFVELNEANKLMYKIQLVLKYTGEENGKEVTIIDHVLEFVTGIPVFDDNITKRIVKESITIHAYNGKKYDIQSISCLINDNSNSYKNRLVLSENPDTAHKLLNHVGRMLYLNYILYKYIEHHLIKPLIKDDKLKISMGLTAFVLDILKLYKVNKQTEMISEIEEEDKDNKKKIKEIKDLINRDAPTSVYIPFYQALNSEFYKINLKDFISAFYGMVKIYAGNIIQIKRYFNFSEDDMKDINKQTTEKYKELMSNIITQCSSHSKKVKTKKTFVKLAKVYKNYKHRY
jgi:hypothetical protein